MYIVYLFLAFFASSPCLQADFRPESGQCTRIPVKKPFKKKASALIIRNASKDSKLNKLNLKKLTYERSLYSRGSGGVHIFKDARGDKYVIKCDRGRNFPQKIAAEIVAEAVYKSLGCPIPDSVVYKYLPTRFYKIQALKGKKSITRITSFIPEQPMNRVSKQAIIKPYLQDKLAVMLLTVNSDLKLKNIIIDEQGKPWLVDSGQFLPKPAPQRVKADYINPHIGQEINQFKSELSTKVWFAGLTNTQIRTQIRDLLTKQASIMRTARVVSKKVHMPNQALYLSRLKKRFHQMQEFVKKRP